MARRKDSPEMQEAKSALKSAQALYKTVVGETKGAFKAFFGKGSTKAAEKFVQDQLLAEGDTTFTKSGIPTITKEQRKDTAFINSFASGLKKFAESHLAESETSPYYGMEPTKIGIKDVYDFSKASASSAAIGFANRRLDALRKTFGDDSAYVKELKQELKNEGVPLTSIGRIKSGASANEVGLKELWNAMSILPTVNELVGTVIKDVTGDGIERSELKKHIAEAKKSSKTMKMLGSYIGATRGSVDVYSEILDDFYDARPGDETTEAYSQYLDILDSLSHPGRMLTSSEVIANIERIANFFEGGLKV